ncbi:uncharacterized protein LTR77_009397 [Saxophila tyrrhenica]|uniref:Uncharacterized protein n=1 Tax=Saxophila tyrrhenica TaxID=1690608 RepID=A0AAV9NYX5_9PEZI|nr:hypothetical protein LTR77_009397 [Saxophila tyrrhenica]
MYQMINLLVSFEPAALCDLHGSDLILAPLPAQKMLWEAPDHTTWGKRNTTLQPTYGLTTNGNLVKADQSSDIMLSDPYDNRLRSGVNWEEWCSGMDAMGGLIMLAAALVG